MLMRTPLRWVRPKRLQPPGFVVPCQPTLAHKVPAGDGWIHELKHDGFRVSRVLHLQPTLARPRLVAAGQLLRDDALKAHGGGVVEKPPPLLGRKGPRRTQHRV